MAIWLFTFFSGGCCGLVRESTAKRAAGLFQFREADATSAAAEVILMRQSVEDS
jgi:hypothetical protein